MSVVIVSEEVTRAGRSGRFTPEEDATIVAMRAAGHSTNEIADALGRDAAEVRAHTRLLRLRAAVPKAKRGPRPKNATSGPGYCRRCTILLARAPAGQGGICGYCAMEEHEQ